MVSWKSLLVLTFAPCTLTFAFCACCDYHWQHGGGVSPSAIVTNTPLAPMVVSLIATCTDGASPFLTDAETELTLGQLALCFFWWWWWWFNYIIYFRLVVYVYILQVALYSF